MARRKAESAAQKEKPAAKKQEHDPRILKAVEDIGHQKASKEFDQHMKKVDNMIRTIAPDSKSAKEWRKIIDDSREAMIELASQSEDSKKVIKDFFGDFAKIQELADKTEAKKNKEADKQKAEIAYDFQLKLYESRANGCSEELAELAAKLKNEIMAEAKVLAKDNGSDVHREILKLMGDIKSFETFATETQMEKINSEIDEYEDVDLSDELDLVEANPDYGKATAKMLMIPYGEKHMGALKEKFDQVADQVKDQYGFTFHDMMSADTGTKAFLRSLYGGNKARKEKMYNQFMETYEISILGEGKKAVDKSEKEEQKKVGKAMAKGKAKRVKAQRAKAAESTMDAAAEHRYQMGLKEISEATYTPVSDLANMRDSFYEVADKLDFTWEEFTTPDNSFLGTAKRMFGIKNGKKKTMMDKYTAVYEDYVKGSGGQKTKGSKYKQRTGTKFAK